MPRAKKVPPEGETVLSRTRTKKVNASPIGDIHGENISELESESSESTKSVRRQRTAKGKSKGLENLVPKSRDNSLLATGLPDHVENARKKTRSRDTVSDVDVLVKAKSSRSRSAIKKADKSEVPVKMTRAASKQKSKNSEKSNVSLSSNEARSKIKDNSDEMSIKTVRGRGATAKSKVVTPAETGTTTQKGKSKSQGKTESSSPVNKTVIRDLSKLGTRQSNRTRAKKIDDVSESKSKADSPPKAVVKQTKRPRGLKNTNFIDVTSQKEESSAAESEQSISSIKLKGNKGKGKFAKVSLTKVVSVSKKKKVPPVNKNAKIDSFFEKTEGPGNRKISKEIFEVSLTKNTNASNKEKKIANRNSSNDSLFEKTVQLENTSDAEELNSNGRWKSFNNKNLSAKRLSREVQSQKRKSSISNDELDPTPTKKPAVKAPIRKVGFQSIAKSVAKNGEIMKKNGPRKTLCSLDILGLLDDGVLDEEAEVANEGELGVIPREESALDPNASSTSLTKLKEKVPVWRKHLDSSKVNTSAKSSVDVFNPENYGEEEFGPEDLNPKKKRARKKKKDTKAILVFGKTGGKKETQEVKKAVKESHNLKTPARGKKTKKTPIEAGKRLINPIPNIFDNPPPSSKDTQPAKVPTITKVTYSSDFSHGAHNYFDSEIHQYDLPGDDNDDHFEGPEPNEELNRSGAFGVTLNVPSTNYKTPAIPKKISRTENSSTPNMRETLKPIPVTIKEQIQCAFGFDESEEDTDGSNENESISISPVQKVKYPVLTLFENDSVLAGSRSSRLSTLSGPTESTNRLSTIYGSSFVSNMSRGAQIPIVNKPPSGPFRVNLPPPNRENKLLAQVKALREKEKNRKMAVLKIQQPTRFSPRKPMHSSTLNSGPIHSSTLLDFGGRELSKPKNAYEMMKEADKDHKSKAKKLVKKLPKNIPALEESSLYEEPLGAAENLAKFSNNKPDSQKLSDKENSDARSPQKLKKPTVSRVYKRKNINNSSASKPSVSFDKSIPAHKTPRKETKKEKAISQWAQLQNSRFSEVEEFDLSFS